MSLILLIEDEKIFRENTQELLRINEYECITAKDGREGLEMAVMRKPDLIVCDVTMPFLDGYEVKQELNKIIFFSDIPFIYITAKSERQDLRNGMDLGAADYLTKPYKIKDLLTSIERILLQKACLQRQINNDVIDMINDFINIMRHECNTPLNAILNLSKMISDKTIGQSNVIPEIAASIHISGRRLAKTLNNLIELSRIQHNKGKGTTFRKLYNLGEKIKEVALNEAKEHKREDDLRFSSDHIECNDFLKIDSVILFTELINNAFKFSDPGTPVDVVLTKSTGGNGFFSEITNRTLNEIEFSEEHILPFKQFKNKTKDQQGSGIGLYLSKLICENYGGQLKIKNTRPMSVSAMVVLPIN